RGVSLLGWVGGRRRSWGGRWSAATPTAWGLHTGGQVDRFARRMLMELPGRQLFLQTLALLELEIRLPNLLEQAVGARVVGGGLPRVGLKHEVAIDELLPLLHLSLEDTPQIRLLPDDMRREDQ